MNYMACGVELAEDAVVPQALAALMSHVAENLEAHARWVGEGTAAAAAERAGLLQLTADYRGIAAAAQRAASTMQGLREIPPAPHDLAHWDRARFESWMRRKIELQRAFAELVLEHADTSERVLTGD